VAHFLVLRCVRRISCVSLWSRIRVDPEAVRDVVRAVIGRTPGNAAVSDADAREMFADAVRGLDEALVKSASAADGAPEL